MKIELEYDDDSEVARALETIAANAKVQTDGGLESAAVDDIADKAIREFAAQHMQQLILNQ